MSTAGAELVNMDGTALAQAQAPADGPAAAVADTQKSADNNELQEVVVTGTSIRGVAPIGSNVITVDQAKIKDIRIVRTVVGGATVYQA